MISAIATPSTVSRTTVVTVKNVVLQKAFQNAWPRVAGEDRRCSCPGRRTCRPRRRTRSRPGPRPLCTATRAAPRGPGSRRPARARAGSATAAARPAGRALVGAPGTVGAFGAGRPGARCRQAGHRGLLQRGGERGRRPRGAGQRPSPRGQRRRSACAMLLRSAGPQSAWSAGFFRSCARTPLPGWPRSRRRT